MWTNIELLENCNKQLKILATNCLKYDEGEDAFGLEICHRLRVLLHNTRNSHSIIHLLNLENNDFTSSYDDKSPIKISNENGDLSPIYGLVKTKLWSNQNLFDFYPYLENIQNSRNLGFDEWWKDEVVCSFQNNFSLTRKNIIVDLFANKTGGSHLDPNISRAALSQYRLDDNVMGWKFGDSQNDELKHTSSPFLASARQIAHELFKMFIKLNHFEKLVEQIYFTKIENYKLIGNNKDIWQSTAKSEQFINEVGDYISIIAGQENEPIAFGLSSYELNEKFGPKDLEYGIIGYETGKLGFIENGIELKTLIEYNQEDKLGICIGSENNTKIQFLQNDKLIHELKNQRIKNYRMCFILKDRGSIKHPKLEKNKTF